jgi:hypothetical protein
LTENVVLAWLAAGATVQLMVKPVVPTQLHEPLHL